MTLAVQVSYKKSDGTIYVVGGNDVDEFATNLSALAGEGTGLAEDVLADMVKCLSPMAAGVANVQAFMPGTTVAGDFYTPNPAGAPRISQVAVAVKIPWNQKQFADPHLAPLKASRQASWDAANKAWILQPGVDLAPFAAWLPPGV